MTTVLLNILLLFSCGQLVLCQDFYRAAISNGKPNCSIQNYVSLIHEAANLKADILVLDTRDVSTNVETCGRCFDYDEIVKAVSKSTKEVAIYVVVHVCEKINCDSKEDIVRSNLVFNRNGDIIAISRKPLKVANCNSTYSNTASFSTDFGVTFDVLMEEDIINVQDVNDNNIVLGSWPRKNGEYYASQLESSWAFISKSNVISVNGIYGNTGATTKSQNVIAKELSKGGNDQPHLSSSPYVFTNFAQSIELDSELAAQGLKENICFEELCCHFYVKTVGNGESNVSYSIGIHTGTINVGPQIFATRGCALVACAGSDQSCSVLSRNSSDITFKTISISGNFSEGSKQFPISRTDINKNIKFDWRNGFEGSRANMEAHDCDDVSSFGIVSVEQSIDYPSESFIDFQSSSENIQELFDYLWIRLRVPIFIVSIYILEMM